MYPLLIRYRKQKTVCLDKITSNKVNYSSYAVQTPLQTAFHDTQRLLLEAYVSNVHSDFMLFAPLMKKQTPK